MSTLSEIQEAITGLREDERLALSAWLESQNAPRLGSEEEDRLLRSLDDALRDLDSGKGTLIEEARKLVNTWAGK